MSIQVLATQRWKRMALTAVLMLAACSSAPQTNGTPHPTLTPRPILQVTATALPSAATLAPTPTAALDSRLITTFAADVDPLTAEKVSDPNVLNRRPLSIVIANSNESGVRPQSGTSSADWVFEHETEAPGITRWAAIFYSRQPSRVGSDRSCRIIDGEIPAIFKSLLACSGFSGGTREYYIKPADFTQEGRTFSPDFGDGAPLFIRTDTAAPPHNLFVDPAQVWKAADQRNVNAKPDLSGLAFSNVPLASGAAATDITLAYHSSKIEWKYNDGTQTCSSLGGCYLRWSDGVAHTDALNGQQLSAANVIVIYVNYVQDPRYLEEEYGTLKLFGWQIQLWGDPGGRVQIFRDGQEFDGTWSRPERASMLQFKDASGNPLPLKPGQTWVQLVPLDMQITAAP